MAKLSVNELLKVSILSQRQMHNRFHLDAQLLFVLEGSVEVRIGEYQTVLRADDVLAVDAGREYAYKADENALIMKLSIPAHILGKTLYGTNSHFLCDSTRKKNRYYGQLRDGLRQLLKRYLGGGESYEDFGFLAKGFEVLDILTKHFLREEPLGADGEEPEDLEGRILAIESYIQMGYDRPISSGELAKKLYLSQGYFSRFFKRVYNMSFTQYLTGIRLYHAMDDLIYSKKPITQIAYDNGFSGTSAFDKAFKDRYGCTPQSMREIDGTEPGAQEITRESVQTRERAQQYLQRTFVQANEQAGEQAVSFDAAAIGPLRKIWDTINAGQASDLLRSDVQEHVLCLAKEAGFRCVRFWNIFSHEMLLDAKERTGEYNFSKLDFILDFLLEHGLKPHIELGEKPRRIYRYVGNAIEQDPLDAPLPDNAVWGRFIEALLLHLLQRYTAEELETWHMELWFIESHRYKEAAMQNFFSQFDLTYRAVKRHVPGMLLGGCGLHANYESAGEILHFLQMWRRSTERPDFISCSCFAYERGPQQEDRFSYRSTDDKSFLHQLENLREVMDQAGFEETPLWVTEWNLTISDRNIMNDTCFKSAFLVKNILECHSLVGQIAYFLLSDRVSESYDSALLLFGGTGLLSKDGILKPAGLAYRLLNGLFQQYVGFDEHCLVTADGCGAFAILCYNQMILNHNYYLTREDALQRENISQYFESRTLLHLTISLKGVSSGSYRVKAYEVEPKAGSILNAWADLDYQRALSRQDIQYLKRICGAKMTMSTVETERENLTLDLQLVPNEIRLVYLCPKSERSNAVPSK